MHVEQLLCCWVSIIAKLSRTWEVVCLWCYLSATFCGLLQ